MTTTPEKRVTYRQVLAVREFRALFTAELVSATGDQVARIAIALLVFGRTGSSFAASATYACSFLTWLIGGPILSATADRYPRKQVMLLCDAGRGLLVLGLLIPHLPLVAIFAMLLLLGVLAPPFESARSATVPDVLGEDEYVVANALQNTGFTMAQVIGFLCGGALVSLFGVNGALLLDAVSFAVGGFLVLTGVQSRPIPAAAAGREGLIASTRDGFALVLGQPKLRWLLGVACLSFTILIPTEGLAVPIAAKLGYGAVGAGLLTAAAPAGYVIGAALVARLRSARRRSLMLPMLVLSAAPLLLSPVIDDLRLLILLWLVAGIGGAVQVVANAEYVLATPAAFRARGFGLAATMIMAIQGGLLLLTGAASEVWDSRQVIAGVAAACLLVVLGWIRLAPRELPPAQGRHRTRRMAS